MSDKETIKKAVADKSRADQARELLSNPLYVEAVCAIRAALYAEFEDSKFSDTESRHELWQRMQLMKAFQGRFESIVKKGEKADQTISLLSK
jgi:hypothetical protein